MREQMISSINASSFRSIEEPEGIRLGKITVMYGPTSSGKSSLLYGALALRNFVINPNRQADGFFHLGFMDLGGFDACVFDHNLSKQISLGIATGESGNDFSSYQISLSKTSASIRLKAAGLPGTIGNIDLEAKVNIPYALNQTFPFTFMDGEEEYNINWNGIACSVIPKKPSAETQQRATEVMSRLNSTQEVILKGIDVAPSRRGFFKPNYTPVGVTPMPTTEDEVASIIINDQHMAGRISTYTEEIFGRDFRLHTPPGTATVFFQTTDKKSRTPVLLVNEGFGINQVIYLLTKMYRPETQLLFIEEPEIHLHPTVIRKFARAMCSFVKEQDKQLVLATHSEQFLVSLITAAGEDLIDADDLRCYLVGKETKLTQFKPQKVHKNGQVDGGLTSFVEAEIADLRQFVGAK